MRSRHALIAVLALSVAAVAMLAAGCGGSASPSVASLGTSGAGTTTSSDGGIGGGTVHELELRRRSRPDVEDGGRGQVLVLHALARCAELPRSEQRRRDLDRPGSGIDPNSPKFQAAQQACQKVLPNGGQPSSAAAGEDAAGAARVLRLHALARRAGLPRPDVSDRRGSPAPDSRAARAAISTRSRPASRRPRRHAGATCRATSRSAPPRRPEGSDGSSLPCRATARPRRRRCSPSRWSRRGRDRRSVRRRRVAEFRRDRQRRADLDRSRDASGSVVADGGERDPRLRGRVGRRGARGHCAVRACSRRSSQSASAQSSLQAAQATLAADNAALLLVRATLAADRRKLAIDCGGDNAAESGGAALRAGSGGRRGAVRHRLPGGRDRRAERDRRHGEGAGRPACGLVVADRALRCGRGACGRAVVGGDLRADVGVHGAAGGRAGGQARRDAVRDRRTAGRAALRPHHAVAGVRSGHVLRRATSGS